MTTPGSRQSPEPDERAIGGWLRVLCLMLTIAEPVDFALVAVGAVNAVIVRGASVALVLAARLIATALCVAAGRALLNRRPAGRSLAIVALVLSAAVQVFAYATPYFPSNRLPGQTSIYVVITVAYYSGWIAYLATCEPSTSPRALP